MISQFAQDVKINTDAVDINLQVIQMAQKHFSFHVKNKNSIIITVSMPTSTMSKMVATSYFESTRSTILLFMTFIPPECFPLI